VIRPLLILDLDETLVYGTKQELPSAPDFLVAHYFVYRRPHLPEFLDYCFTDFDVAVWTSASRSYASEIVARLFGDRELRFFWSGERCTQRVNLTTYEQYTVKDLRKVRKIGFPLEQILMVDDSPEKLERHYGNHIRIPPFEGDPDDVELLALADYLRSIRLHPNYRAIEKRHWRTTKNAD
jgi:TFIIF-interacting CTD phosphatase-like protein